MQGCYIANMVAVGRENIHQTRVLDTPSKVAKQVIHIAETSSDLSIVSLIGGLAVNL